jgi:4'-phosphopantetheinyl transferase
LLLGSYLGCDAREIDFRYGEHGKPSLTAGSPAFNLSHSGPVALFAVCAGGQIGIDVELDHADFARERIAERFFSPAEVAALRSLAQELQPRAFLTCWTRKEALIKARGDGLSLALDSFDVSLAPGQPPALLRTAWSSSEPAEWSISDLSDRARGYIAATACRNTGLRVRSSEIDRLFDQDTFTEQEAR